MPESPDQTQLRLVMRIATALHGYGSPSHRLEETLSAITDSLGLEAQYLVTPTSVIASVGNGPGMQMFLERVEPGDASLEKLTEINHVIHRPESKPGSR